MHLLTTPLGSSVSQKNLFQKNPINLTLLFLSSLHPSEVLNHFEAKHTLTVHDIKQTMVDKECLILFLCD